MQTIATIQYSNESAAMIAAHTKSIDEIEKAMGVVLPRGAYLYVNSGNQIKAATVARDAYPSDELFFIGRAQ